jgi:hypothetical protein
MDILSWYMDFVKNPNGKGKWSVIGNGGQRLCSKCGHI